MKTIISIAIAIPLVLANLAADPSRGPLSGASIALRAEGTQVLIVGPAVEGDHILELWHTDQKGFPELAIHPMLSPAEITYVITRQFARRFVPELGKGFQVGVQWQIYPGAGPSATVIIEKLVLLHHGDGGEFIGAVARFTNPATANRIAGLAAAEYLAIPGPPLPGLSQVPIRLSDQADDRIVQLLFDRGREVVRDSNWMADGVADPEELARIHRINDAFLMQSYSQTQDLRMWRWAPGGGRTFLLVEAVWTDEDRRRGLFAVDAVVLEGKQPEIISFDDTKARWMRASEFNDRDWRLGLDKGSFLNAWKLGADYFVLTYASGYEGYGVELKAVDFIRKELAQVIGFGD